MHRAFWRPFLIFAAAVLLLGIFAHFIPATPNKLFPIKKLDLLQGVQSAFQPTTVDSLDNMAKKLYIASELAPLKSFMDGLQALQQNGTGNIRIAYFGDSIIEGDLITGKLREQFQAAYGGSGVGLVPVTSIVNEFRKTIRHSFSRNWETLSFMNHGSGKVPLGMIGYTFIPRNYYSAETVIPAETAPVIVDTLSTDSLATVPTTLPTPPPEPKKELRRYYVDGPSWVEYSGVKEPGGAPEFRRIRLFYSHASANSQVRVSLDGGDKQSHTLRAGEGVNVLDLSPSAPIRKIRLEFSPLDPIHVYGVSFDDTAGFYLDNLSVRGYSGLYFNRIPADILSSFQAKLGYDLVILQYGENVSSPQIRDYSNYKRGMINTVRHIQSALPGVPILILSAHDRSIKQNGVLLTSPDIPILVNTQGEIARSTGCAFWNVFEAMGGLNSMLGYVKAKPALANLDYTHFTRAGANKIALLLYNVLITGHSD